MEEINHKWKAIWEKREPDSGSITDIDDKTVFLEFPKLFYARDFFETFANEHDMDIVFLDSNVKGYWNNEFVFNCYLYKRLNNQNI